MYPVISINRTELDIELEVLGTKPKFWYQNEKGCRFLFKAEVRGTGDDWAEKISCEICSILGLPHVHYDLSIETSQNTFGVICETCSPEPNYLFLGNEALHILDLNYPLNTKNKYKVSEHTVDAVAKALKGVGVPQHPWIKNLPSGIEAGLSVFVGYVMLDTLVSNQDRHHENWGLIWKRPDIFLAPTFDHGASLAGNITDEKRASILSSRDKRQQLPAFVRRARSGFYANTTDKKAMGALEAFKSFGDKDPEAMAIWLDRLNSFDDNIFRSIVSKVPAHRMSDVCREFTIALLVENRDRLLEGIRK